MLPAAFNWWPDGVVEWQAAQILAHKAEPLAEVGVAITLPDAGPVSAAALVAVTEQVYCVPLFSPLTTTGDDALVPVPLGEHVAVYWLIVRPPLLAGGLKEIETCMSEPVPTPTIGAPGAVAVMATFWVACVAALKLALPPWLAAIVHAPAETIVTVAPLTVQMPGVVEL